MHRKVDMREIELRIDKDLSGKTVKEILFDKLFLASNLVTRLKSTKGILVNDECVTVRLRPMLEQIIADTDGTLYTVFESNARLYSDGSVYNDINSFDAGSLVKK